MANNKVKVKARAVLEDLTFGLCSSQMNTIFTLDRKKYLEAQECYRQAKAELAGAKATISNLEIFSDKEMDAICKNTLKKERCAGGLFKNWSSRKRIAWKSFFFPVLRCMPVFLYLCLGFVIGETIYKLVR